MDQLFNYVAILADRPVERVSNPMWGAAMPRYPNSFFEDEIAAEKARLEAEVAGLENGPKKYQLLKRIRQLETASHVKDWLSSPGLQPPSKQ